MTGRTAASAKRLYGRRKGHRLSRRRQRLLDTLLPSLRLNTSGGAPARLESLYPCFVEDVWLEIGFGAGEHLVQQACGRPDVGFVGCEPFINGVANLLAQIEERRLENVLVYDDDARDLLGWLPAASLGRVFVLFPDPWPKKRHHKRRLLSPPTLAALSRVMRPGAELRVASDIPDYVRFVLLSMRGLGDFEWIAECAADWRARPADWPETRYERKAAREGRRPAYLSFRRL